MNRKFDNLGRINLPKEMRDKIGLGEAGSEAKIELIKDKIVVSNPDKFDLEAYIKEQMEACKDNEVLISVYVDILEKMKRV